MFHSRHGQQIFPFSKASGSVLGPTQPPIQREPGALFSLVKQPEREADRSLPPSADVRMSVTISHLSHMHLCHAQKILVYEGNISKLHVQTRYGTIAFAGRWLTFISEYSDSDLTKVN